MDISVNLHYNSVVPVHVATISILQRRQLRLREVKQDVSGHTADPGQGNSNFYTKLFLRGLERVCDGLGATQ